MRRVSMLQFSIGWHEHFADLCTRIDDSDTNIQDNTILWKRAERFLFNHMTYAYTDSLWMYRKGRKKLFFLDISKHIVGIIWGATRVRQLLETRFNSDLAGLIMRYMDLHGLTRQDQTTFFDFVVHEYHTKT